MSSPYLDSSSDGASGTKGRLRSTDRLLKRGAEADGGETGRPHLSRRFSIGGLFHRAHQARDQSIPTPKLSRRASVASTSSGRSATDHASSETDSAGDSPLRRTKSLVGRLFRRRSQAASERMHPPSPERRSSHHVSSMYMSGQQGSSVRLPDLLEEVEAGVGRRDGVEVRISSPSSLVTPDSPRASSTTSSDSAVRRFFHSSSPLTSASPTPAQSSSMAVRVITSSRCVLTHAHRLLQGTMILSSQNITFNCSVLRPRFTLNIPHGDIVAIIPFGDRTGIKVATQRRCLLFQGFPERDEFLQLLMEQWMAHCRTMLLADATGASRIHDTAMACAWFRQSTGVRNKLPPAQLKRAKSIGGRPMGGGGASGGAGPVLPVLGGVNSCGCMEHYKHDVVRMRLQSTPLAIAGVLFGLAGSGISYAGTFFRARGGNTVEETPWTWDGDIRRRTIITNVPDAFRPTTLMRVEVAQRVTHESADIIVVDASLTLKRTSFGNNYKCHLRWCIVREQRRSQEGEEEREERAQPESIVQDADGVTILPIDASNVRVSAEVTCTGHAPLPLQVVEERLIEFVRTNFTAMLETLRVRFQVASQETALCEYPARTKMVDRAGQFIRLALFLTVYRAREYLADWVSGDRTLSSDYEAINGDDGGGQGSSSRLFYYWASGVLLLFILVWTLVSHHYNRTAPLATYDAAKHAGEGLILPSHLTDETILRNVSEVLDFLEDHLPIL